MQLYCNNHDSLTKSGYLGRVIPLPQRPKSGWTGWHPIFVWWLYKIIMGWWDCYIPNNKEGIAMSIILWVCTSCCHYQPSRDYVCIPHPQIRTYKEKVKRLWIFPHHFFGKTKSSAFQHFSLRFFFHGSVGLVSEIFCAQPATWGAVPVMDFFGWSIRMVSLSSSFWSSIPQELSVCWVSSIPENGLMTIYQY